MGQFERLNIEQETKNLNQINIVGQFKKINIGQLNLVQETADGRIRQIGLTAEQSKQLQSYVALISKDTPLLVMDNEYDLILRSEQGPF